MKIQIGSIIKFKNDDKKYHVKNIMGRAALLLDESKNIVPILLVLNVENQKD